MAMQREASRTGGVRTRRRVAVIAVIAVAIAVPAAVPPAQDLITVAGIVQAGP